MTLGILSFLTNLKAHIFERRSQTVRADSGRLQNLCVSDRAVILAEIYKR